MSEQPQSTPLAGVRARAGSGHYGVFDHGAHVWAWQPDGQQPVLWMSARSDFAAGQPIRGGVPLVFPWFGSGREGALAPAHGFARRVPWHRSRVEDTVAIDGRLVVEYELDRAQIPSQPDFPFAFVAALRAVFTPEFLEVGLTISNADAVPFSFEEALHTYLAVGDVRQVTVAGLDGARYLDRAAGAVEPERLQDGLVTFEAETDRVYLDSGAVVLDDPVWGRQIRVTKSNSANTVVWNPWVAKSAAMADFGDDEWPGMVCIEAGNLLGDAVTLAPGDSHVMRQLISVDTTAAGAQQNASSRASSES